MTPPDPCASARAALQRPSQTKKKPGDSFLIAFGIYGGVGFQLAAAVIGGLFLGQFLDRRWGTEPWLTLTGLMVGAVGGFVNLIRILNWHQKKREKRKSP